MRLILHVGLHRAASSSIQRLLVAGRRALARRRVLAVTQRATEREEFRVFKLLKGTRIRERGPDRALADIERHLESLARDYDTVVFSDENMPGLMPGRHVRAFACRAEFAEVLRRLSQRHDVHVVAVLREHADYLESVHRFRAVRGEARDFAGFVAAIDLASLDYAGLLDAIETAIGPGRLEAFAFEALAADRGRALVERLGALIGAGVAGEPVLPVVNVSPDARFVALAQVLHARGIALARKDALALAERLRGLEPGAAFEEAAAAVARAGRRVLVPLTGDRRFKLARGLADRGMVPAGVSPQRAADLVAEALAAAGQGAAAAAAREALKEDLRRRFAADRAVVAARHLADWAAGPKRGRA